MKSLLRRPWFGPLVALITVYLFFLALRPATFASWTNLGAMACQTVVVVVAAVGMTLVIVQGGIDLSVGSGVAFTTVVTAWLLKSGSGPAAAVLGGVLASTLAGLANGGLITRLKVAPFIITLGSMSVLRGLAKGLANEQKIDVEPRGLEHLMGGSGGFWRVLPPGVWIALGIALLAGLTLTYTRFGRYVYALGSNEQTARLCGINVPRVRLLVYTLAGMLTGVAGILEFSTLTVGDPTDSVGLELEVIAAVVIGGGSLSGGEGSILGTLVGALLMTVIKTGGMHLGLPNWVQEIVTGAIIVVAAAVDRVRRGRGS